MSVDAGMESSDGGGEPLPSSTATPPAQTQSSQDSGSQGSATPPAEPSGGPHIYGGDDLTDPPAIAPPRSRDASGRFAPRTSTTEPAQSTVQADTTVQPETPAATPTDWLNPDLKGQSAYYGFTEAEARSFETPDRLYAAMSALDRRMLNPLQPQQPFQGQVPAAGQNPAQAPAAPGQPGQSGLLDLSKYQDKFDPDTLEVLNALQSQHQAEFQRRDTVIEELHGIVQQLHQQQAIAEEQRFEQEMDSQFENFGQDYEDLFGKGPIRELPAAVQQKRQEFVAYMKQLEEADMRVGRPPAPLKLSAQRVLRSMYGERQTKAIRNQVAREVEQRRSQVIARPTARNSAPLNPLEAAARRADEIYKSKGFDVQTRDDYADAI